MMSDARTSCEVVRFGAFTLDMRRRVLTSGGVPVPLDDKPLDLLIFLVMHREAAVSREAILAHVWRGRTVDVANVAVQLSALRSALKHAGCRDRLILTQPGPRYRFIADAAEELPPPAIVVPVAADSVPAPAEPPRRPSRRRRLGSVAAGTAAAVALLLSALTNLPAWFSHPPAIPRLSMVVLPFRNPGPDRDQDHLAGAITDDLISDLAHIPGSTVIARESAAAAKGQTPQAIGQSLRVRYVVGGTLYHEDATYRVTAYLIDTANGAQLWNEQFSVPDNRLSEARENIVSHVASALHFQLDQLESTRSLHDRPNDPDALDLFFRARARLDWDDTLGGFSAAQSLLEQSLAKQPDFADAQATLGWLLLRKINSVDDPDEDNDYERAKRVIADALASSPQNVMALAARARERQTDGNCAEAQPYAAQALAIDPSSLEARSVLAQCYNVAGDFDDAATQYNSILKLNPDSPSNRAVYRVLGYITLMQGKAGDAIRLLDTALAGQEPISDDDSSMGPIEQARLMLIAAYELTGDHVQATRLYGLYARQWAGRTIWRISGYLPKSWLKKEGVKLVLQALERAGMPRFASENDPTAKTATCDPADRAQSGDFAPTPRSLPGGETFDTEAVEARLASLASVMIIDVGRGLANIPNAIVWDQAGSRLDFVRSQVEKHAADKLHITIIVAGDGPAGCIGYRAASMLIAEGYRHVAWYRGGEEAWSQAVAKEVPSR